MKGDGGIEISCHLMGGYFLTGAERNGIDELVRSLYDAVKPRLYIYDRYADAYLHTPMWSENPDLPFLLRTASNGFDAGGRRYQSVEDAPNNRSH